MLINGRKKYWINELKRFKLFCYDENNNLKEIDTIIKEIKQNNYKKLLDKEI